MRGGDGEGRGGDGEVMGRIVRIVRMVCKGRVVCGVGWCRQLLCTR